MTNLDILFYFLLFCGIVLWLGIWYMNRCVARYCSDMKDGLQKCHKLIGNCQKVLKGDSKL